ARWIYPGEVDRGGIALSQVTVDGRAVEVPPPERRPTGDPRGRDVAGADVRVPIEPGPAREIALRLRFDLEVPGRFGRVGRAEEVLALAGPWYPVVVDGDGWAFEAPHEVELEASDGTIL